MKDWIKRNLQRVMSVVTMIVISAVLVISAKADETDAVQPQKAVELAEAQLQTTAETCVGDVEELPQQFKTDVRLGKTKNSPILDLLAEFDDDLSALVEHYALPEYMEERTDGVIKDAPAKPEVNEQPVVVQANSPENSNPGDVSSTSEDKKPPRPLKHVHRYEWNTDVNYEWHWQECIGSGECDQFPPFKDREQHTWVTYGSAENYDLYDKCSVCGLINNYYWIQPIPSVPRKHKELIWHTLVDFDGTDSTAICRYPGCWVTLGELWEAHHHVDEDNDSTCDICGDGICELLGHYHRYDGTWSSDTETHWIECHGKIGACRVPRIRRASHVWGSAYGGCSVCGYGDEVPEPTEDPTDENFENAAKEDATDEVIMDEPIADEDVEKEDALPENTVVENAEDNTLAKDTEENATAENN